VSLPRAPKAVVFDMDGLLVDTEAAYHETMIIAADAMRRPLAPDMCHRLIGLPWDQCERRLRDWMGEDFPTGVFHDRVAELMAERAKVGIALKDGVAEILDALDDLRLPRAVATSSGHASVRTHLGAHGMLERFDAVVAKGDYARGKPHPDPFLEAARRLEVPAEHCLALEDSHNGVRAAGAAGMMTVMVPDLLEPTEEMHGLCVAVARSLHDVREWLGHAAGTERMERRHA